MILVYAPLGRDAELTVHLLTGAGLPATSVSTLPELLDRAQHGNAGALLLTAEAITRTALPVLVEALANQPHWSDLPVLVLVPGGKESSLIGRMEHSLAALPNLTLLERPIRPTTLFSIARNSLRSRTRQYEVKRIMEERDQTALAMIESEKLAAVGRLASSIAHEINNPLEAVTNLFYLIRGEQGLSQAGRDYMDTAERELARVSQIASQTLRFHRQSTSATSVQPDTLLAEVLNLYKTRLASSRIAVEQQFDHHLRVTCYEGDVRQVLSNLVGNAFDVMRNGGRLRLRTREATWWPTGERGALFTVADDGPGMTDVVRRRIFDAFYSTKGNQGTGLGLWISRRIVHKHRGHLTVRSMMGRHHGTVFNLWLPFALARTAREEWHTDDAAQG